MSVIKQITDEIEKIEGVRLLDVDGGYATNRTVVTFVGTPDAVVEAAFQAIKKAAEVIDMSKHTGEHPRMGATDVCPLIPIANITMEETVAFAHKLAKRVGEGLAIPVYCYESAALHADRKNLATIRAGEYEGLPQKLKQPEWKPDFGQAVFNAKSGATVIGARDFLIAYNFNLNTTSVRRANSVAFDVREAGRVVEKEGKKVLDEHGEPLRVAGTCPATKAIGWYIAEYGIAQVSMNLTNINVTPLHVAFDEVCKSATNRGMRVTGSELVGLVPLKVMVEAGKHFLRKQQRSVGVSEAELIHIAVKSLGLDELKPFDPNKKIIEYLLKDEQATPLVNMKLNQFAHETASESPAPGGGSVAAYVGALGVSLGTMVANLSAHKKGWDSRWAEFSDWAEKGQVLKDSLLHLVDEDTKSFNAIMVAFGLPKGNETEKAARHQAIQEATKYAIEVPLQVMETALHSFNLLLAMAADGNPNSVSDAGVGALCACAAVRGAYLNVKINAASYKDKDFVNLVLAKAQAMEAKAVELEEDVLEIVNEKL